MLFVGTLSDRCKVPPWRVFRPRQGRQVSLRNKDSVQFPMRKTLCVAALAAFSLTIPAAVADAATVPAKVEGVTVTRYLMARIKPSIRARGAAHLWTNTGFSNR